MSVPPLSVSVEKDILSQDGTIWQQHAGLRVDGFVPSGKLTRLMDRRRLRLKTKLRKPRDILEDSVMDVRQMCLSL